MCLFIFTFHCFSYIYLYFMMCIVGSSKEASRTPVLKLLRSYRLAIQILILNRKQSQGKQEPRGFPVCGNLLSFCLYFLWLIWNFQESNFLNTPASMPMPCTDIGLMSVVAWLLYLLFLLSARTFVGCTWTMEYFIWRVFKINSCCKQHWMKSMTFPQVFLNCLHGFKSLPSHDHTITSLFSIIFKIV